MSTSVGECIMFNNYYYLRTANEEFDRLLQDGWDIHSQEITVDSYRKPPQTTSYMVLNKERSLCSKICKSVTLVPTCLLTSPCVFLATIMAVKIHRYCKGESGREEAAVQGKTAKQIAIEVLEHFFNYATTFPDEEKRICVTTDQCNGDSPPAYPGLILQ